MPLLLPPKTAGIDNFMAQGGTNGGESECLRAAARAALMYAEVSAPVSLTYRSGVGFNVRASETLVG